MLDMQLLMLMMMMMMTALRHHDVTAQLLFRRR